MKGTVIENLKKHLPLPFMGGQKRCLWFIVCLSAMLFVACGDDDDDTNPHLKMGGDSRPTWILTQNMYQEYESTMAVQVTLQDELLAYASEEDLMRATIMTSIDGEMKPQTRALTSLQFTAGEPYFSLIIAGNSNSGSVTLQYYCAQLNRIYTVENWMPFSPGIAPTLDDGKPYVVEFIPTEK